MNNYASLVFRLVAVFGAILCSSFGGAFPVAAQTTDAASVAGRSFNVGAGVTSGAGTAQISQNGRYLFYTSANGLSVPGVEWGLDQIYRFDRLTGTTVLVSQSTGGAVGNNSSATPVISADGNIVAFISNSSNLVAGGTGIQQIYVRNIAAGTTTLASQSTSGAIGNGTAAAPSISADGNLVAFLSSATNLVAGVGHTQIYLRNLNAGTTILVSQTTAGLPGGDFSTLPAISADGSVIAFKSSATLVPGANGQHIYARNLALGTTVLVSQSTGGAVGNMISDLPIISGNGRVIVFQSNSTNLVAGATDFQLYARNLADGTTVLVNQSSGGAIGDGGSSTPTISQDGNIVAFLSNAGNLIPGVSGQNAFVRNFAAGTTLLVNQSTGGVISNAAAFVPVINADGTAVAFQSTASNLVNGVTGLQIYVRNLVAGTTSLVSQSTGGAASAATATSPLINADGTLVVFQTTAVNLVPGASSNQIYIRNLSDGTTVIGCPRDSNLAGLRRTANGTTSSGVIHRGGRYVFFRNNAEDIVAGSSGIQVFRFDRNTGETVLVSQSSDGMAGNNPSDLPTTSNDGNLAVFGSTATNLVAGVSGQQVYLRNFNTGTTALVSQSSSGVAGNGSSSTGGFNSDGTKVFFISSATNLVAGVSGQQIYLRDLVAGTTELVSQGMGGAPANSNILSYFVRSGGNQIVFTTSATNLVAGVSGQQIYSRNLITGTTVLVSQSTAGVAGNNSYSSISVSENGSIVTFFSFATNLVPGVSGSQVYARNLDTNTTSLVSQSTGGAIGNGTSTTTVVNAAGTVVVFQSSSTNLVTGASGSQVYLRNLVAGTTVLVSQSTAGVVGNNSSNNPVVSADGTIVGFLSGASNFAGVTSGVAQFYFRNMVAGTTELVSQSTNGSSAATPQTGLTMSSDGRVFGFLSTSPNLVRADSNANLDIFVRSLNPCAFSINPTSATLAAAGGAQSVTVSTTSGCEWSVSGTIPAWLTVVPNLGSVTGSVMVTAQPNPFGTERTATFTIAGQSFTVTQSAATSINGQISFVVTGQGVLPSGCGGYANDYFIDATLTNVGGQTLSGVNARVVDLAEAGGAPPALPFRLITADGATCGSGGLVGAVQSTDGAITPLAIPTLAPGQSASLRFRIALPSLRRFRFIVSFFGSTIMAARAQPDTKPSRMTGRVKPTK